MAILLGALECKKFNGELLSYEGTFGVGYGLMKFNVLSQDEPKLQELEKHQSDPYVRLAREALSTFLINKEVLKEIPDYVTDEMKSSKRGVFVSLKKYGNLRGCIGTILPITNSCVIENGGFGMHYK